jgi:cellobiose phosphorylase
MRYGYFDDQAKEYVITRPDTAASWSNYLGSTEYGAIITNNAGGYGFFRSGREGVFFAHAIQQCAAGSTLPLFLSARPGQW